MQILFKICQMNTRLRAIPRIGLGIGFTLHFIDSKALSMLKTRLKTLQPKLPDKTTNSYNSTPKTLRNPMEPQGTPRNPRLPQGTLRNPKETQGIPRNPKKHKKTLRYIKKP